jgi:transcriptional regulator with XRE-family HTH domain
VKQYHNKKETVKIGEQIRKLRKDAGFSIDDIAHMTGFGKTLLSGIENGAETGISHVIEIAKAIGVHPREIFNLSFVIKPRFKKNPQRQRRNLITYTITKITEDTDFFNTPRFIREIVAYLNERYKTKVNSISVAAAMRRLSIEGKFKIQTTGRQNQYYKKAK